MSELTNIPGSVWQTGPPTGVAERAFDGRWIAVTLLLIVLIGAGAAYSAAAGPEIGTTFATRAVTVYAPLAALLIFWLGWHPHTFPIAAALFYGFLGTSQFANRNLYLLGDVDGAITVELLLAIPLILTGLLGPSGGNGRATRSVPALMSLAWFLVLGSAVMSTLLADAPRIALYTFVARILVPILVTVATYRRLRHIKDFKVVWLGFVLGMLLIAVFQYRRVVLGILPWYASSENQRFLSITGGAAIPLFLALGPLLWYGHALAVRRSFAIGVGMFVTVGFIAMLIWLGAHRGPLVFFFLLVLWWMPGHVFRHAFSPRSALLVLLGGVAIAFIIVSAVARTTAETGLVVERLQDLWEGGLQQQTRWQLWMYGLERFAQSPIWGVGLNNWIIHETFFTSIHSSFFGILFDMGILGLIAFGMLFGSALMMSRNKLLDHLPPLDREFSLGMRAGWVTMMLLFAVNLPFTSGQPVNNIFSYAVFLYPAFAMLTYGRHPQPQLFSTPAQPPGFFPVPPSVTGALPRP